MPQREVILAIDCSLRLTGAALAVDGMVSASESADHGRRQSAELPLMTEKLLKGAGLDWRDITALALTSGPGYFTGLRVGAAYGSALAYALGVKVIPVSSLEMLAAGFILKKEPVLSVVYAGRGFVYAASFGHDEALPAGEYDGAYLEGWLERNIKIHKKFTVVSDDPLRASETAGLSFVIQEVLPSAASAAQLACRDRVMAMSPMELRISYHRAPQGT